jgi:hypothetical protein
MISKEQTIQEILAEAESYGRKKEVEAEAKRIMAYFMEVEDVDAYQTAFNRIIELDEKNK